MGAGVVVCLELGADLHMAQLMPLPLTVSCFSKIQIGFTFRVPAHLGSPGKRVVKRVCVRLLLLGISSVFVLCSCMAFLFTSAQQMVDDAESFMQRTVSPNST